MLREIKFVKTKRDAMKILLRYRDNLSTGPDPAEKMRLRFFLGKQLKRVWGLHFEEKHPADRLPVGVPRPTPKPDSEPYFVAVYPGHEGYRFIPLVTHGNKIQCSVEIRYGRWRSGGGARIFDNGDLDARLKALLDGLSAPAKGNTLDFSRVLPEHQSNTCYVLTEDDRLIDRVSVETFEILDAPKGQKEDNLETVFHVMVTLRPFSPLVV